MACTGAVRTTVTRTTVERLVCSSAGSGAAIQSAIAAVYASCGRQQCLQRCVLAACRLSAETACDTAAHHCTRRSGLQWCVQQLLCSLPVDCSSSLERSAQRCTYAALTQHAACSGCCMKCSRIAATAGSGGSRTVHSLRQSRVPRLLCMLLVECSIGLQVRATAVCMAACSSGVPQAAR